MEIPWSTRRAAEAFKVEEEEVYQALASLTAKVPENIQIFYDDGSIRIVADLPSNDIRHKNIKPGWPPRVALLIEE